MTRPLAILFAFVSFLILAASFLATGAEPKFGIARIHRITRIFSSAELKSGQTYRTTTVFRFSSRN